MILKAPLFKTNFAKIKTIYRAASDLSFYSKTVLKFIAVSFFSLPCTCNTNRFQTLLQHF